MSPYRQNSEPLSADCDEPVERVMFDFELDRRRFVQSLGAGLLLAVGTQPVIAQRRGGGARQLNVSARIHLAENGRVTVLTGKVEMGQGARAELTQAAAEELRVPVDQIEMLMADTAQVPDDGTTAGSRTTPSTVPAVRAGAAAARELLVQFARQRWMVDAERLEVRNGAVRHPREEQSLTYADLARAEESGQLLSQPIPANIRLTPVGQWKILATSVPRPHQRDLVTGAHKFPSDLVLPEMLYGKVLRPPAYGAKLVSVDLTPARAMENVAVVQDGEFVGVAAPTSFAARQALDAIAQTAQWERAPHPSSGELYAYLRKQAEDRLPVNPFADTVAQAAQALRQTYHVAYVQHVPLEPRVALAQWQDGKLTVWTGTQAPFGYQGEIARAFRLPTENVRVVVPDFGSGFGGKHTAEAAIEAARLARGAGRPVSLQWTREEEFTWAYFRPAAVIEIEASLNGQGRLTSWHFLNINSGGASIETPYQTGRSRCQFVPSNPPLRQGSYRTLAATANNFAREAFMDELAAAAGRDPLEFRLAHLEHPRLRPVLEEAAARFRWKERIQKKDVDVGVGLACGTEKGSYVAACVEVALNRAKQQIEVRQVTQVFECGAILNPDNLLSQVQSCILMGMGPALREEMRFENGQIQNASFRDYLVPRFTDVPQLDIHLMNRTDLDSAGGGETPIIAIAPAIANAVFHASGRRVHSMPIPFPA